VDAGAEVAHHSGGLVDYRQIRIFVNDIKRDILGEWGSGVGMRGSAKAYLIAGLKHVTGFYRPSVDLDQTRAYPDLDLGSTLVRALADQVLIQPGAFNGRGNDPAVEPLGQL
jgi:hypothetical protein